MERKSTERNKALIYSSLRFTVISAIVYRLVITAVRIVFPYLFGHEVSGRENLENIEGGIAVSNHCTYLDPGFIARAVSCRKLYFTIQEQTIDIRGFGYFLRCLHGFPLPGDRPMDIAAAVASIVNEKSIVHFFPEGVLYDYNQEITDFHPGAFYFAMKNNVPVIPVTTVVKERRILGRTLNPPWVKIITVISPAVPPPESSDSDMRRLAEYYASEVRRIMQAVIDGYGGDKNLFNGRIEHHI